MARLKLKAEGKLYEQGVVVRMQRGRLVDVDVRGHRVLCHMSGRICRSRISLMPDDNVLVELDQADLSRGRIVWRLREGESLESLR